MYYTIFDCACGIFTLQLQVTTYIWLGEKVGNVQRYFICIWRCTCRPGVLILHPLLLFDCFQHHLTPTSPPPLRWGIWSTSTPPLWLVLRPHLTHYCPVIGQISALGRPPVSLVTIVHKISISYYQPLSLIRIETVGQTVARRISYKKYQYLS